jgi:cobyric acid synthase
VRFLLRPGWLAFIALVAGLCPRLARQGASVAPVKAQNQSKHSGVTAGGGENGRAQAMPAHACGHQPSGGGGKESGRGRGD